MLLSALSYAGSGATIRALTDHFSPYQLALIRAVLGTLVLLPWLLQHGVSALRTERLGLYAVRAVAVYSGNLCWFYALAHLHLADATALSFLAPLFGVVVVAFWLGESLGPMRIAALLLGVVGALVIVRPGFQPVGLAVLAALYVVVAYGTVTALIRGLALTENANAIVFYQFALHVPLALGPGIWHWQPIGVGELPWVLAFGVLSFLAQYFMTRSLACAEAAVVMPTYYLQLPLVALLGFALFEQVPDWWLLPGALLIVGGSYVSVWSESRAQRPV
jgi:drug/metabolite transporter (DMT)-like permease